MATASIYKSLLDELGWDSDVPPPTVMASLIDASVLIAMGTDTRDLGIIGMQTKRREAAAFDPPDLNPERTLDCGCVVDNNQLLMTGRDCTDPSHHR
jgi:hypothetical protein